MTYVLFLVVAVITVVSVGLPAAAQMTRRQRAQDVSGMPPSSGATPLAAAPVAPDPGNPFTAGGPQAPGFARGVLDREGAAAEYERLISQGMHPREAEDTARLRHTANTATD